MRMRIVVSALIMLGAIASLPYGCGGDDEEATTSASAPSSSSGQSSSSSTAIRSKPEPAAAPLVVAPGGPPPQQFVAEDLTVGEGDSAEKGNEVVVDFNALLWDGGVLSNSWTYEEPVTAVLGGEGLLDGVDRGIRGMKVGGSRRLLIPADMVVESGEDSQLDDEAIVVEVHLLEVR